MSQDGNGGQKEEKEDEGEEGREATQARTPAKVSEEEKARHELTHAV